MLQILGLLQMQWRLRLGLRGRKNCIAKAMTREWWRREMRKKMKMKRRSLEGQQLLETTLENIL
jgi:hypothetical protein